MRDVKRHIRSIAVALLALCCAAMGLFGTAGTAECRHTYTIRISAGTQGLINGQESVVYGGLNHGDRVNFNMRDVSLKDGSKYYVKGVRLAGRDNNTSYAASSFLVDGDADYVIAYGLLTDAVAYTVEYVDASGKALAPAETYYGNVGDKPVVAFLYIEGYRPNAYNLTGTLKADASKNVFRFTYTKIAAPQTPQQPEDPGTPDPGSPGQGTQPSQPGQGGQPSQPQQPGQTTPPSQPPQPSGGGQTGDDGQDAMPPANDNGNGGEGEGEDAADDGAGQQGGANGGQGDEGQDAPNINPGGIPVIPAEDQSPDGGSQHSSDVNIGDTGFTGGQPQGDGQGGDQEPEEIVDIDDEDVPLANLPQVLTEAKLLGIPVWIEVLFGIAVLGIGGYLGYRYYQKRRDE